MGGKNGRLFNWLQDRRISMRIAPIRTVLKTAERMGPSFTDMLPRKVSEINCTPRPHLRQGVFEEIQPSDGTRPRKVPRKGPLIQPEAHPIHSTMVLSPWPTPTHR